MKRKRENGHVRMITPEQHRSKVSKWQKPRPDTPYPKHATVAPSQVPDASMYGSMPASSIMYHPRAYSGYQRYYARMLGANLNIPQQNIIGELVYLI